MTTFSDLGLTEDLLRALSRAGYATPTPIQAKVIPPMHDGRDLIGIAQTGTGKTASFVLPLLQQIAAEGTAPGAGRCHALVLVPTRELAIQVADALKAYGRFLDIRHAVVIGGANARAQVKALKPGVDVVVATPGRLEDHMAAGAVRLDRTARVVLDEADQMLDLGFMPAIRRILGRLPATRQTVLMSATMPKPIRALAADFLTDPLELSVAPAARPIERIVQRVLAVAQTAKRDVLAELLRASDVERAIVFTRTKRGADRVAKHLCAAGLKADAIHGNKSQGQRQRALDAFRAGRAPILVATDIAARGIDVDGITHVVNFDLPNVAEAYVHRIGRTARAGRDGMAISLCDPAERPLLRDIEKLIGARLPVEPSTAPPARAPANANTAPQAIAAGAPNPRRNDPSRRARNGADRFPRPQPELGDIAMATGSVKWFNSTKGYGFICPDEGGSDVFVHISAVERSGLGTLSDGQRVNYDIEVDQRRGKSSAVNLSAA